MWMFQRFDRKEAYASQNANQYLLHSEQVRWGLLYYYLVANSVLVLAWAAVFAARPGTSALLGQATGLFVLELLCFLGFMLGLIWWRLQEHFYEFVKVYEEIVMESESFLPEKWQLVKRCERLRGKGCVHSSHVLKYTPLLFSALYLGLAVASI